MTIRRVICLLALLLAGLKLSPVSAEPSLVYQYCLTEGIKSFEQHHDQEAIRYFQRALLIEPSSVESKKYLNILHNRFATSENSDSSLSDVERVLVFDDFMRKGEAAWEANKLPLAAKYFLQAHRLSPDEPKPLEYLNLLKRLQEHRVQAIQPSWRPPRPEPVAQRPASPPSRSHSGAVSGKIPDDRPRVVSTERDSIFAEANARFVDSGRLFAVPAGSVSAPASSDALPLTFSGSGSSPAGKIVKPKKGSLEVITLDDLKASAGPRVSLRLEMGTSIILEGKNIQKFLLIEPGIFVVKMIGREQLQIDALRRGGTFLHIWDENGRLTIYVEVILPQSAGEGLPARIAALERARQFRMSYSADWGAYYYGNDVPGLERRSLSFLQKVGLDGETPYGVFDTSATIGGYNSLTQASDYTVGLSGIPLEGTSNLNLRLFDADRFLSPLTLPGGRLRGTFADVNLLEDRLGLSFSHGQRRSAFGFVSPGFSSPAVDSYINAAKITLFPKDEDNQYAFNYATGYGQDRDATLTKQVYSVEGQRKIDKVTLNAELARDRAHNSGLAGVRWDGGQARTALNVRDLNKNFTTVTSAPSNQGEVGATWTANLDGDRGSSDTVVDVYRDRQFFNPNNPDALNYDTNTHVRVPFNEDLWTDANARYVDTPGELSPRRYAGADMRLSRNFPFWGPAKGTVFAGSGYQKSRYAFSPASEYDRQNAIIGAQIPLTTGLSCFANYDYSWLHEPLSGMDSNPNVFNTGLSYNTQFSDKLAGTCGLVYRDEQDVRGTNSFLSGEDSVTGSAGLTYNPTTDVSYFIDGRLRNVWAQTPENPSYNDLDVRFGMRAVWGVPLRWDPHGIIGGFVFKDKNGDGKFSEEDEGLEGVKVKVGEKEAVTDRRGWYYADIRAKKAGVTLLPETVPAGFIFSTPAFMKVDIIHGKTRRIDFGLTSQSGLYGVVFVDKNGNGVPDQGDQFIGRVKLVLDENTVQKSDSRGTYFFKNISEGQHTISIDMKTLPPGLIPLIKLKNDISVAEATTYVFHIPMRIKQ